MRRAILLAILLAACTAPEPPRARSELRGTPALIAIGPPTQGPPGSDAPPRRALAFRMPDGSLRPIDREAIAFVPRWRGGAALVDPERRLYEVRPDGTRRMLAAGASGSLAASPDSARLVYAVARGVLGELRVHDGTRERTIASGLASIGVLRIEGARVFFVGARPGGVAGVWTARLEGSGARCLTNCDLITGKDWRSHFVPPPSSPEAFVVNGATLGWRDPEGATHAIALEEAP